MQLASTHKSCIYFHPHPAAFMPLLLETFSQTRHEFVSRPHNQSILHRQMESHGHYLRFLTFPLGRNREERRKKWRGEQVGGKGKQKHWERDSETESERETTRARSKCGRIREISLLTFGTTNTSPERKSEGERWGDKDRESRKEKQEIAEKTWQTYEPIYKQYVQNISLFLSFQCW